MAAPGSQISWYCGERTGGHIVGQNAKGEDVWHGGVSQQVAGKALHRMATLGGFTIPDPETARNPVSGRSELRIVTPELGNLHTLFDAVIAGRDAPDMPKPARPGGDRRRCPDHPDAPLVVRQTTMCSVCGQVTDESEKRVSPPLVDAITEGAPPVVADPGFHYGSASTVAPLGLPLWNPAPGAPADEGPPLRDLTDEERRIGLRECAICHRIGRDALCPEHEPDAPPSRMPPTLYGRCTTCKAPLPEDRRCRGACVGWGAAAGGGGG